MSSTLLSIRTDAKTKKAIADFAASVGLSTSAFVTSVTLQAIREQRVILTPDSLEPTPYLQELIKQADADYSHDRNITHTHSPEEALAHIDSLMKKV